MRLKKGVTKRLSTAKSVSNVRRFNQVSDSKLNSLKTRWLKKRTFNKMQWGVKTFKEWRSDRLASPDTFDSNILDVDLDSVRFVSKEKLIHALCRFIPEVTKKDGGVYPGKTLY